MNKRSKQVTVGALLLAAAAAYGALEVTEAQRDYSEICVDDDTMLRVEDTECAYGDEDWYYIHSSQPAPAVGQPATGGTFDDPGPLVKITRIQRGGFGGKTGGAGG